MVWWCSYSTGVSMPRALWRRKLDAGLPALSVQQLDLHAAPECFDHGVIVRAADGAHDGAMPTSRSVCCGGRLPFGSDASSYRWTYRSVPGSPNGNTPGRCQITRLGPARVRPREPH